MLLVIAYSRAARRDLRNVYRGHEDAVVRQFGRAALFEESGFAAFHVLRLREKHGRAIQVERTRPLDPARAVPDEVERAASSYAARESPSTPYGQFAAGRDLPDPETMKTTDLRPPRDE